MSFFISFFLISLLLFFLFLYFFLIFFLLIYFFLLFIFPFCFFHFHFFLFFHFFPFHVHFFCRALQRLRKRLNAFLVLQDLMKCLKFDRRCGADETLECYAGPSFTAHPGLINRLTLCRALRSLFNLFNDLPASPGPD